MESVQNLELEIPKHKKYISWCGLFQYLPTG